MTTLERIKRLEETCLPKFEVGDRVSFRNGNKGAYLITSRNQGHQYNIRHANSTDIRVGLTEVDMSAVQPSLATRLRAFIKEKDGRWSSDLTDELRVLLGDDAEE